MTKPPNTPAAIYLKQVASLNPMWRSSELVDLRASQFRIPRLDRIKTTVEESGDLQSLRNAHKDFLNRIQAQFWQLPQPVLLQQLASINTAQFPELVPVLDRLKTVANCRGEFPKLAHEPWMVSPLFHAFKTAVVLPQADAGIVRERFTASIPRQKELKAIQLAVAKIEQIYPVLYALERNFFQTLLKLELNPTRTRPPQYESWPTYLWIALLAVFIMLRVLFKVLGAKP